MSQIHRLKSIFLLEFTTFTSMGENNECKVPDALAETDSKNICQ